MNWRWKEFIYDESEVGVYRVAENEPFFIHRKKILFPLAKRRLIDETPNIKFTQILSASIDMGSEHIILQRQGNKSASNWNKKIS